MRTSGGATALPQGLAARSVRAGCGQEDRVRLLRIKLLAALYMIVPLLIVVSDLGEEGRRWF